MTEQITIFTASLRMRFWRSKSTLDSLKRVFNVLRRKLSLGVPTPDTFVPSFDPLLWIFKNSTTWATTKMFEDPSSDLLAVNILCAT